MNIFKRLIAMMALLTLAACGGGGNGGSPFGGPGAGGGGGGDGGGGGGNGGGATGSPTLTVSTSSATITSATPATITVTLLDANSAPLAGRVVTVGTLRGGLATLAASSVLTNAQGVGTVGLQAAAGGLSGADEVQATATVNNASVSGSVAFAVTGASATVTASITPDSTLRASETPAVLAVVLRDDQGAALAGQLVNFSSANGLVTLGTVSALTDATGQATTTVRPASASTTAADTVSASTTVNGRELQSSVNVQLVGESPALTLALSNSNISAAAPATVTATVRDAQGALVNDAVVSFSTQFNLGQFDPATARTADGVATSSVSPRTATTTGADQVLASVTVAGVTVTQQAVAQFSGGAAVGTPTLDLALSSNSISAAAPADVTVTLRDARGTAVAGQVVSFASVRGLATTNVPTALTNASGVAVVRLSPASSVAAGADEVTATVSFAGTTLQRTAGFQVQATPVTLVSLTADDSPLSAYGQTTLRLALSGASVTSPVNIGISSSCVSQGKATLSPASFTATSNSVEIQYRDNGCGAVQAAGDQLQATVTATGASTALTLPIAVPAESSIAFVEALPEQIFLRGSGFTETSVVTFEVRDAAGNPLPNRSVQLRLQTGAGGVTMEGRGVESVNPASPDPFTANSDAQGRVSVRVNSGTLPTPVRIDARLAGTTPTISTVSSNLSVAVGLPSQLNFSLSQGTKNIEGYNIDGTPNTYQIIAADRSGNPVPEGTSINFITEGGQIEAIKQTQLVGGIARTTANFVSSSPRPVDGRVTVTVYALGEESFLDLNGNNAYDSGEPFQDLGNIFRDRLYDGAFDPAVDEIVPLTINNRLACVAPTNPLLNLDPSIPSMSAATTLPEVLPGTCDGVWSGAGQVYVRRAVETVLSTSAARPLWAGTRGLTDTCTASQLLMQIGPQPSQTATFLVAGNDTWYGGSTDTLSFIVADANPGNTGIGLQPRLNPMAAGTVITATTPTPGLTVSVGGGTPVPSTTEASGAAVVYTFTDPAVNAGVVFVTFRSPSGLGTTISVPVVRGAAPSSCPAP